MSNNCSPTAPTRFAIADWDRPNHWKVLLPSGEMLTMTKDEFLQRGWRQHGVDMLVAESAHLKERNLLSVAQVYTAAELNSWTPDVPVRLFSAKMTKKARGMFKVEDKAEDTSAIYSLLDALDSPLSALKTFSSPAADPTRSGWDRRNQIREEACKQYNLFRTEKHGLGTAGLYGLPSTAHCASLLGAAGLDDDTKEVFAIRQSRNGMRFDITPVMSLYFCAVDPTGNIREESAAYIVKDVVGLHCFGVPNLIRANFMHFKIGPADRQDRAKITRSARRLIAALKLAATKPYVTSVTSPNVAAAGETSPDVTSVTNFHVSPGNLPTTMLYVPQGTKSNVVGVPGDQGSCPHGPNGMSPGTTTLGESA